MVRRLAIGLLVVGFALVIGCDSGGRRGSRPVVRETVVEGTVFYRERIALPRDAMVNVKLVERQRGRDRVVAGRMIGPVRRTPIAFELAYDPREIDDRHEYVLEATILVDRQPWMVSSRPAPCLTHGHGRRNIEVLVRRAR
jgi:putative lipoprotein